MKNEFGDDMMGEVERPVAAGVAAQPSPAKNSLGDPIVESDHGATLVNASSVAPDAAAKSIDLANKTGTSAQIIQLNPERHERDYNLLSGTNVADKNPYIQNYINNIPLSASVSRGDWDKLDESSKTLSDLHPHIQSQRAKTGLVQGLPEMVEMLGNAPGRQRLLDALKKMPEALVTGMYDFLTLPGKVKSGEIDLNSPEGMDAAINFGLGVALTKGAKIKVGTGEGITRSTPAQVDEFLSTLRGMKTREEIDAFLASKTVAQPKELLQIEQAKNSAEGLSRAVEAANETATKERSASAFEDFAESHGDLGTVHIPAQTILDIYSAAGKIPIKGDGLFGFIPRLAEKATTAAETGAEIAVPIGRYIANIDPAVHEKIADVIRLHQDGTTTEEAKELQKELQKEEPSVEEKPLKVSDDPVVQSTVDAITKERKALYLDPVFKEGKDVNITEPEFKRYSDLIDRANETILQKAVDLAAREVKKRQTDVWKRNEAETFAEVETDLRSRPDFAVDRFLRTGDLPTGQRVAKIKLNKAQVEEFEGEGRLDKYIAEDGANLDSVATQFGFDSGASLVRALQSLDKERQSAGLGPKAHFDKVASTETDKRMEAKYGSLEDNIAIEASNIALQDFNVDLLAAEWRMLATLNGKEPPLNRTQMTQWVKDQFDRAEVSQVKYETWRRAAEKSGRETEKSLLKKDYEEAFKQKQSQMLNFLLAKEAKGFEKEVAQTEKLIDKYSGVANIPKVSQEYTDQVHSLMIQYGIPLSRTKQNVEHNLAGKDLATFITEKQGQGALIVNPTLPLPPARPGDFTVSQYRDFASLLKNLDHAGRREKEIEVAGKKEDFENAIDRITKNLDMLEKAGFDPDKPGVISSLRAAGRYVDSKLWKAESFIDVIDRKDPLGAMNQTVLRGLVEGEQKKGFMIERLAKMAREMPNDRAWGKALNDLADNRELRDWETGELLKITNENKISIAANYGNMGNRRVMLNGHHFTEEEVEAFLDRTMSDMDWKMVNALHGLFKPLAPLVEETTRKRSGLAVPLVEPTPFLKSDGGYWPLMRNPRDVLIGAKQATDLFDKTKFDPLPMAPALKQRTGAVYKLDFSLNRLNSIISQTVHAVYMQDPVINANKVIKDPLVREGIVRARGPEYVTQLDDWIKDIANNGGQNDDALASWMSRNVRENVTVMLMGYKASTALIHGGSAAAASVYEMGRINLKEKGAAAMVGAPAELVSNIRKLGLGQYLPEVTRRFFSSESKMFEIMDEVMGKSGELPNRVRSLQKDFGYELGKLVNVTRWDDLAQARTFYHSYSMAVVSYLDFLTAVPVWKAKYDHSIKHGVEEADAIYMADKAVREAHGSASLVSRANIGRGEVNKWITIAYNGYWNHNYQKIREASKDVFSGAPPQLPPPGFGGAAGTERPPPDPGFTLKMKIAIGAGFVTAMIVAPALVHHAVRGEEEETLEGAIAAMMASQLGGTVPLVNTLTYSIIHNRDPSISPIETALKSITDVARDIKAEEAKRPVAHAAKAAGYITGMGPTNQIIDSMSFMNDFLNSDQNPESASEWARGFMTGKSQPKEKK